MKKITIILAAIAVVVLFGSCATGVYIPGTTSYGLTTEVVLSKANYRIVRNIDVTVEITNSKAKKEDVEKSAYSALLKEANLTGSQALANVIVEQVRRQKIIYVFVSNDKQYVTAHATIIEFLNE